ncbi:hypothetical protein, variant [Phytophthora nicotianae]|uniref:Uncharacterized protein n=2 Tax=Phytophthora nicotianae TaxID=4792 RepID=V9F8X1_PHYNI|nr:hypothetical protein, variant [Phytophthora nicotianae P1569]ETM47683.1 hypothetical protein, variant [Phytophthora nicotianae]
MSSALQKETTEEHQEMKLDQAPSPSQSSEKQTQDTETEEEGVTTMDQQKTDENQEENVEAQQEENNAEEKQEDTMDKEGEKKTQEKKTPAKAMTPMEKKTPSQATSASKSATKRKFDALHARNAAAAPSISEHEKNKKARASALMKTPGTKPNGVAKKTPTKPKEFSFARPTASSASRTTAIARDHAHPKTTPTHPPARKPLHPRNTPANAQQTSTPAPKTPTDKTSRPHFNYTPYTGPLPPLTVESSFAPKGSQNMSQGNTKLPSSARKPRPASVRKTPQSSTARQTGPPSSPARP